jgi:flagellar biosynthesis activator protein FlaF
LLGIDLYKISYADVQADSQADSKEREREIMDRSIELLSDARAKGAGTFAAVEAVHYTVRIWTAFLEDLARDDNQLTKELRANLISIGIWILRECDAIRQGQTKSFDRLIEISQIIRGGLDEKHVQGSA